MASSDSDRDFEVDRILNQRKRKGALEYLVRWRGFGDEEDSWEPAKNLGNAANAIAEFIKLSAPVKTPKKSTKSRSRSRSRSRGRTPKSKTKSPSRRARSRTPRSRSRSSSRGRAAVKESPSRQSKTTEVVTRRSTNTTPGRVEKTTQVIRQTTDDRNPSALKTTRVVHSRVEVKTVEDKDSKAASRVAGMKENLYTMWQTADTAVLIIFVCVSIIVLSYVVENYCSPSEMWKSLVGLYTAFVGAIVGLWEAICGVTGRVMQSAANFTRNSWKKVTTN